MSESKLQETDTFDAVTKTSTKSNDEVKCHPINTQMVQNIRLIWLDANIDENDPVCHSTMMELRRIINTINGFTDSDQCIDFLTDMENENICMIISNTLCENIIPLIHNIEQLQTIFIFCENETIHQSWTKNWFKIKDISTELSSLCQGLNQVARQCEQNSIPITPIDISDDCTKPNLDKLDPSFMYTHIFKQILLSITFDGNHIKEYSDFCCEQYADNNGELNNIKQFESGYHDKTPIWWYTYQGFLYTMLNRGLRLMNTDTLIKMGFFIKDLHHHLDQIHKEQFHDNHSTNTFMVYRGQGMSNTEFDHIKTNKGGLLAFNNFLSTSKDRDVAFLLAESNLGNPNLVGIFFIMTIDPSQSTTSFASISDISHFQEEDEVLFVMQTIFRIDNITSIDENPRFFQVELSLTSDNDKDLRQLTDHIQQETERFGDEWHQLGALLLLKMGQFDKADEVYQILLKQCTNDSGKAVIYGQLGSAKQGQGQYLEAITLYEKALEIFVRDFPLDNLKISLCFTNIGMVYQKMGEYSQALSHYEVSLAIQEQTLPPNHPDLAGSYNNIGLLYNHMNEYSKALTAHGKALEIHKQTLPPNHPDIARVYNNIGFVYKNLCNYTKALWYYNKAFAIQKQSLPANHPNLTVSYNNIGEVYKSMGQYAKALSYYEKSLETQQQTFSSYHPDLTISYNNIANAYYSMGEYSKALIFHEKCIENIRKLVPLNYFDLAMSYNNIGLLYYSMNNDSKALSFYEQSLEIQQKSLLSDNSLLPMTYNNAGMIYSNMGEYSKAFSYYEKSIDLQKQLFPSDHPILASIYNNIGMACHNIRKYSTAVSYYEKSVEIHQKFLPSDHPDLAKYYNNIGNAYYNMNEYSTALLYHEQALEIQNQTLPPNHPDLVSSYVNMGLLYERMNDYEKANEFYQRAVKIEQQSLTFRSS